MGGVDIKVKVTEELSLEELENNYIDASNALDAYRVSHGFIPKARVLMLDSEGNESEGVIPFYGLAWRSAGHLFVPVGLRLWKMSQLTLVPEAGI